METILSEGRVPTQTIFTIFGDDGSVRLLLLLLFEVEEVRWEFQLLLLLLLLLFGVRRRRGFSRIACVNEGRIDRCKTEDNNEHKRSFQFVGCA